FRNGRPLALIAARNKHMKSILLSTVAVGLLATSAFAADNTVNLKDAKQRATYCIRTDTGNNFKRQDIDIDPKAFAAGLADALAGKSQLTDAEVKEALNQF